MLKLEGGVFSPDWAWRRWCTWFETVGGCGNNNNLGSAEEEEEEELGSAEEEGSWVSEEEEVRVQSAPGVGGSGRSGTCVTFKIVQKIFTKTNQRKREDSGENVFSNCFLPCSICSLYLCPGMSSYSEQKNLCHHKTFSEDLGLFHLLIFK